MNFNKLLTLLLLLITSTAFAQNSLVIENITAGPGETTKINIALDNESEVTGFQFTLKVPNDLIVDENEVSFIGRNTNHVIYPKDNGNGEYLFICFSATNDNFTGNSGNLIEIPIETPVLYLPGETYNIELENVILSSSTGEDVGSDHQNGVLTVVEGKNPDLVIDNINFSNSEITPGGTFELDWNINNIGEATALGGWREQIYVSAEGSDNEYLVVTDSYDGDLDATGTISRNTTLNIPKTIGFDGVVKVKIILVPYATVKETETYALNNTTFSNEVATLQKKITFSIDKNEVTKNSEDEIKVDIKRSGDTSIAEEFTITSSVNGFFELPITVILNEGQSSNIAYVPLITNTTYTGSQDVVLTALGNGYSNEITNIRVIEDQKITLSIDYPTNHTSSIGDDILFTLKASGSNTIDKIITINSDYSSRISFPNEVTLLAGQTIVTFTGTVLDPGTVEKKVKVTLNAESADYISAIENIELAAVNIPEFELELSPSNISEGDGLAATYATLRRTTHTDKEVAVRISANIEDKLILPDALVFEVGELEKKFNIGAVDNSIVEGDQLITVYSKIFFLDCACTDETDSTTKSSGQVTIVDNDGLALIVAASPSTIKAGVDNNTLIVSRNVTSTAVLGTAIQVNLTSNLPTVLNLPSTVTIPVGESEVEVSFDTVIDASLQGDQSVRIEANAGGYAIGYGWVLITDQNLPDVIISEVQLLDEVEAGTSVEISTSIINQGFADFGSNAKLEYYLSETSSTENLEPFNTTILTQGIATGETYNFSETVQLPIFSGILNLITVVNANSAINELSRTNNQNYKAVNFLPAYSVTVSLDKQVYLPNEKVIITGKTKRSQSNESVKFSDVEITISDGEFIRVFTTITNENGDFVYEFEPVENESGNYSVAANYPGAEVEAQTTFDILGFEIVNKEKYIKWEPFVDFPLEKQFVLKNNTSVELTGVSISLQEDAVFELEQTAVTIGAGEEVAFNFNIITDEATIENAYVETRFTVTSNEGGTYTDIAYFYSRTKNANLIATPTSISTTMVKDMVRNYEFTIQNIGDVDAIDVAVDIPFADWISLKSPELISVIKAGEEAKVYLEFEPTLKEQLNVPISGSFLLKASNSEVLVVPFRIETVSEETGSIVVDATDEYTYNTVSAPHLAGATVQVKHPYTGEIVAEGITNEDGLFEVPSISEGYYTVNVSADKHAEYQATILVDPGRTLQIDAFMQYQAVTYRWDVVSTEIEDEYEITLITEFETNVPKPVIVMEVDNSKLDLEIGETRQDNITITNHGLIEAYNVTLGSVQSDEYEVTFLIESLETLPAKTTVVVPIILKRIDNNSVSTLRSAKSLQSTQINDEPECSFLNITARAFFICQGEQTLDAHYPYDGNDCVEGREVTVEELGRVPFRDYAGGTGFRPYSFPSLNITIPDFCDSCVKKLITSVFKCSPAGLGLDIALCGFSIVTSTGDYTKDLYSALSSCKKRSFKKVTCYLDVGSTIITCLKSAAESLSSKQLNGEAIQIDKWDYILEDLEKLEAADDANIAKIDEYLKNPTLRESDDFILFLEQIMVNLDSETPFSTNNIVNIKEILESTSIEETYLDEFFLRWNTTSEAWSQNVFSPNELYPDIVDKVKIQEYEVIIDELDTYTTNRGFVSSYEMYNAIFEDINEYSEEKSQDESSVCATITIEFPQTLTMTREAFEGTLTIDNGSDTNLTDVLLDLEVTNEIGENKTDLFQINKEAFLDGSGSVNAGDSGKGVTIFIPTKEAAPQVAQSYSFGGVLSYYDSGIAERVYVTLNPVTLEVNPNPDLILDYFLQRNIFGDDPLTENIVEPSLPAELSLMITNDGYGVANNVKVESMQPEIVDNEKGLLIDFEMIGSNFNNEPKELGLLEVDYGTIPAKSSSVGQWYFTSSLIGHFVSYDINVNHVSDFSNENLSLIKEANIHELIKSVSAYQDGNDEIADFLVNDESDAKDTPDRIYLSNGTSEEVFEADLVASSNNISAANLTTQVTINPFTTGWNYGYIVDPGADTYKLLSVVRDNDGVEMPLDNFWQTSVTLRDGLNPKYENNLHVLDNITQITTYTLSYAPIDENTPIITSITGVPDSESSSTPLKLFTVNFNKEIDVNSFTTSNISLVSQGKFLPTGGILIGKIDETTYSINLEGLTDVSGYYELTVSSVGIKDLIGNEGANAERVSWIQFLNELGILKFESDQIKKAPLNSVSIVFNKEIRSEEFDTDNITINGNPVDENILISKIDDYNYSISGIDTFNKEDGEYILDIDLTLITAEDGTKGLAVQSYSWTVDNSLPTIITMEPVMQAGIHDQNITEIHVELNKALSNNLDASAITFYKDGVAFDASIIIQETNDLNYKILGLGAYTIEDGDYSVSIDQTSLIDQVDNIGAGIAQKSWTVNTTEFIGVSNVSIEPDNGLLDDDGITSGDNIELVYETLEDNLTVQVYELVAITEVLIDESLRGTSGEYAISLNGQLGAKRFKVVAINQDGNISEPQIISTYIDFSDFDIAIEIIKESAGNECYDFDYVDISFSEKIEETTFTLDAITIKSSGIEISKDGMVINKISDLNYRLENIINEGDGSITLEIDKTKIIKEISGLPGIGSLNTELGVSNKYVSANIEGDLKPLMMDTNTYNAPENFAKYDWIIANGEIVSSDNNSVEVNWNTEGEQTLILRYKTYLGCTDSISMKVDVQENPSLPDTILDDIETTLNIGPNPNKGQFSIHTNQQLNDCKLDVFNVIGELVYSISNISIGGTIMNVEIPNMASGLYILVITHEDEKFDFRMIID